MCEQYGELLYIYQKAVALFHRTLEAVEVARPTVSKLDYERLVKYAEQAQSKVERAADELKVHAAKHDCFPAAGAA